MPYVREARRAFGLQTLTAKVIRRSGTPPVSPTAVASSVAVGDYPTDLHGCKADGDLEGDLQETSADLQQLNGFFPIPYGVMVPSDVDGLLLAEKNFSQSRIANGATRLQPSTMLVGQAAGAAAALAATKGVEPRHLAVLDIQKVLVNAGAFISQYQFADVPRSHPFWPDVQLTTARGIPMGHRGVSFGVGETLTRAQAALAIAELVKRPIPDVSSPDDPVTRAEFSRWLARGLGQAEAYTPPPGTHTFIDVPSAHSAYRSIEYLVSGGIVVPCAAGTDRYCPDEALKRGDAARFFARSL